MRGPGRGVRFLRWHPRRPQDRPAPRRRDRPTRITRRGPGTGGATTRRPTTGPPTSRRRPNDRLPPYTPPKVWKWDAESGGRFAKINRPIAGATHEKELPVGEHPLQLYSLATPNGVKVTVLLEELLALGKQGPSTTPISSTSTTATSSEAASSRPIPNSKIPALVDHGTSPPTRVFESGAILVYLAEKFDAFLPDRAVRAGRVPVLALHVGGDRCAWRPAACGARARRAREDRSVDRAWAVEGHRVPRGRHISRSRVDSGGPLRARRQSALRSEEPRAQSGLHRVAWMGRTRLQGRLSSRVSGSSIHWKRPLRPSMLNKQAEEVRNDGNVGSWQSCPASTLTFGMWVTMTTRSSSAACSSGSRACAVLPTSLDSAG